METSIKERMKNIKKIREERVNEIKKKQANIEREILMYEWVILVIRNWQNKLKGKVSIKKKNTKAKDEDRTWR